MTPNPPKDQLGVSMVVSGGAVSPENRSNEEEIRALCDAATPGPWEMQPSGVILGPPRNSESLAAWVVSLVDLIHDADAEFIVAARTIVPSLLDRLDDAKDELAEARAHFSAIHEVDLARESAALARIAAVEAPEAIERAAVALYEHTREEGYDGPEWDWPNIDRSYDYDGDDDEPRSAEWLRDRYRADARVAIRAALAASPTPTGPEPWKCARPGRCACEPLRPGDEHCRWFPATPEPTEETP